MSAIRADGVSLKRAQKREEEALEQLDRRVRLCYRHIAYLAPEGDVHRRVGYIRIADDSRTALDAVDVWGELNAESKAFGQEQFSTRALLYNLRPNDYGIPLREVRDNFWSSPHKPLLPEGEAEFTKVVFQAVEEGRVRLVDDGGGEVRVSRPADINSHLGARLYGVDDEADLDADSIASTPEENADVPVDRSRHWQATLNVTSSMGTQEARLALADLLRHLADRVENGEAQHIVHFTQVALRGDEGVVRKLEEVSNRAGTAINAIEI